MQGQETKYVAVDGPAYYRKSPVETWRLLGGDFAAHGDEAHQDEEWEWIDGIPCEVFRLRGGGMIAQPSRLCEIALEPEIEDEEIEIPEYAEAA